MIERKIVRVSNSGLMSGWTSHIPAGLYKLTKDTELYLGYYQAGLKGMHTFSKGTVIKSHGRNGLGIASHKVYVIQTEDNLQRILDNSVVED